MKKFLVIFLSLLLISLPVPTAFSQVSQSYASARPRVEAFESLPHDKGLSLQEITPSASQQLLKTLTFSDHYTGETFTATVADDGKTLNFSGKNTGGKSSCTLFLKRDDYQVKKADAKINASGEYSGSLNISGVTANTYYLSIHFISNETPTKYDPSYFYNLPFVISPSAKGFLTSYVKDENSNLLSNYTDVDLGYYTQVSKNNLVSWNSYDPDTLIGEDTCEERFNLIHDKAVEVTNGKTSCYDKILAVHDWLADNIYYDYYALSRGDISDAADPWYAFETKRGVCSGYSRLCAIMLRSIGIACIDAVGFASTLEQGQTFETITPSSNHEWNWAYDTDSKRWIVFDATWSSDNKYTEDGVFEKGELSHLYFDVNNDWFSMTHKTNDFYFSINSNIDMYRDDRAIAKGNVLYKKSDATHYEAWMTWGSPKTVSILPSLLGLDIAHIDDYFMFYDETTETVNIPENIESIGEYSFYGCTSLKKAYIRSDSASIGEGAFTYCDDLTIYAYPGSTIYSYAESRYLPLKALQEVFLTAFSYDKGQLAVTLKTTSNAKICIALYNGTGIMTQCIIKTVSEDGTYNFTPTGEWTSAKAMVMTDGMGVNSKSKTTNKN